MQDDSFDSWIEKIREGDEKAARDVWERFFPRLVRLARVKMQGAPLRVADEEDVALSAMKSFFRAAREGRFDSLDKQGLWYLLATITARKAIRHRTHFTALKRGGGAVQGHLAMGMGTDSEATPDAFAGNEHTPEFLTAMHEELDRLLGQLRDDTLRRIAIWKMEGYSNDEIADQLSISNRSVERKLRLIRDRWSQEAAS
jgi:DNA-directed RNA polymerase specialized sigma24 family protein